MARSTLAALTVLVLLTSGCVSNSGGKDADVVSTSASPHRYEDDPDKPKRVCESTMEGSEAKTFCY